MLDNYEQAELRSGLHPAAGTLIMSSEAANKRTTGRAGDYRYAEHQIWLTPRRGDADPELRNGIRTLCPSKQDLPQKKK